MNAEALIGTVLGTCTLQKLVGQGGMGAVFLAQQSRPRRQVAVKVLLPMTPLSPHQLVAFLERFRRETDAAASLEHPNITPVHEYGEQDGLAYLVKFAIPLVSAKEKGLRPRPWLQLGAATGFFVTLLFVLLSVQPVIPVASKTVYLLKVVVVVVGVNFLGWTIYRTSGQRST